jgi:hypothetical protein
LDQDNSPVFKVSRVLWFPMSVNAVALGALAYVGFWAWTVLWGMLVGPRDFEASTATLSSFLATIRLWLTDGRFETAHKSLFILQAFGAYALWAILGVAIARIMAVRIARDEYITMKDALAFAWSTRFTALLYAPAIVLSMLFLWLAIFGIGLVGRIPYAGWLISALLLPIVVFFTILVRILAFAGVVSMGMTAGAIACEKKGTWDSVAKAFNYLFARPLAVLLYVVLLAVFIWIVNGLLLNGTFLRDHVSNLLVPFFENATYKEIASGSYATLSGFPKLAAYLHAAVFWVVDALIAGALISWILGAFTAMFLIFRKEVDGTEYTDIVRVPSEIQQPAPASPPAPPPAAS